MRAAGGDNGPDLLASADHPAEAAPEHVIVKFNEGASRAAHDSVRRLEKLERVRGLGLIRAELARVSGRPVEDAVRALEHRPEVEYAEPDYVLRPTEGYDSEPYFGELWGLDNTGQAIGEVAGTPDVDANALEASSVTLGDPELVVAVIDSGIDFSHPDLAGRQWTNPGESGDGRETNGLDDDGNGYVDDINGWDFHNVDATVYDLADGGNDGTHVAGTIAANLNGQGVVGVAPGVRVMSLKYLGPDGGATSNAILALGYARSQEVPIANNSWGGGRYSRALEDAIEASGLLFVASAGNSAVDIDTTPYYPASYDSPNILSVAALDNTGALASFSNYGAAGAEMSTPARRILSTLPGGSYGWKSGTSMATPHATGAAALVKSVNPGLGPLELKWVLMRWGKPTPGTSGRTVTGRMVDARAAVDHPDARPPSGAVSVNGGAAYTKSAEVGVEVPATDDFSGVSHVRLSSDGESWYTSTYTTPIRWSLSDPAYGAPPPMAPAASTPAGATARATGRRSRATRWCSTRPRRRSRLPPTASSPTRRSVLAPSRSASAGRARTPRAASPGTSCSGAGTRTACGAPGSG